jgi:gamma-glutamyltranspeptidase/glutathione hydrolase
MFRRFLATALLPLALWGCPADPETLASTPPPGAPPGVVSAADPRAAEAGAAMLRKGGSATDAAIAAMIALTVVEPQSSGVGGGGFYVRGGANGSVETIDGRETAPMAAGPNWFLADNGAPRPYLQAVLSGLSVGVPGNIRLAAEAHARHGRLDWAELFEPAIALARDGFVLTERGREYLAFAKNRAAATPEGLALFYDPSGEPLAAGTLVKNPALAATLEMLAREGPDGFYAGANAQAIVSIVSTATPGARTMVTGDIEHYVARLREPVCGTYRAWRICGMGPPSSGATTVIAILKQLEHFDLAALGKDSPVAWHLFAESQRLAYADRELYLADEDFVQVPVGGLVDDTYLAERGALISPERTMASVAPGSPWPGDAPPIARADGDEAPEGGTSHFVAVDAWGNAVTYTSTVEGSFGSGLMVGGYYLNNELTDFSFSPEAEGRPVANRVEPGKRPRSSMAPTLVYDADGRLVLAIGAAGGGTIPVQVAKSLIGYLDWGLTAEEAIALPVLYSPGDAIAIEQGSALEAMIPALEALGHRGVAARRLPLKANAVEWRDGRWVGAADPRSEGVAVTQ